MNQLSENRRDVYSVTTDGFITDATVDEVAALDLYGLEEVLGDARVALTGDPSIWETKHAQSDLVNFTTRGNVSLDLGGVCAHNGLKAPKDIVPDSIEDRELLLASVVSREGRVPNGYTRFPTGTRGSPRSRSCHARRTGKTSCRPGSSARSAWTTTSSASPLCPP